MGSGLVKITVSRYIFTLFCGGGWGAEEERMRSVGSGRGALGCCLKMSLLSTKKGSG